MFHAIIAVWAWFSRPYRANPRAAKIEISVFVVMNAFLVAYMVLVVGMPLDDMLMVKLVNLVLKTPIAPQYYAMRTWLYAAQVTTWWKRLPIDMAVWGLFQSLMYSGIVLMLMTVCWVVSIDHFQFPREQLLKSVLVIWVSSTVLAGPLTSLRDPLKAWLAPDPVTGKVVPFRNIG